MKGSGKGGGLAGRGEQGLGALLGRFGGGDRVDLRLVVAGEGAGGVEATGGDEAVGVSIGDQAAGGTVGHEGFSCGRHRRPTCCGGCRVSDPSVGGSIRRRNSEKTLTEVRKSQ